MEGRQAERGDANHDAVQDDKVRLILHDGVSPALGHLADTEDATDEDGQVGQDEAAGEELEACRVQELDGRVFERQSVGVDSVDVVGDHASEDEERKDLPHDTGHHEVVTGGLQGRTTVGRRCDSSTRSLQDEREEIGSAEDPGVEPGLDAGEVCAKLKGDVFEGKVDAGGDKGGGDDETGDLNVESVGRPGVVVEH